MSFVNVTPSAPAAAGWAAATAGMSRVHRVAASAVIFIFMFMFQAPV